MRHGDAVEHGSIALKQLVHAPIPFGFKMHAEMAAEFAAVQHDRIADRLTFVVVCFQRRVNIVMGVEVPRQCLRIRCPLAMPKPICGRALAAASPTTATRPNTINGAVKS